RVRYHLPVGRRSNAQPPGALEVGLLEGGVHRPGGRDLKLRVEIDLTVCGGGSPMKRFAGANIGAVGDDLDDIGAGKAVQDDPTVCVGRRRVELAAVEHDVVDPGGDEIEEGRSAWGRTAEADLHD